MKSRIQYSEFERAAAARRPAVAVVLGSGMSADRQRRHASVSFSDVPGLAAPSVAGHAGRLSLVEWADRPVLLFEGRLHRYEGHDEQTVTAPVRLAAALGVKTLLMTNAAGGIRDDLVPGSLMAVRDHIEWTRPDCWRLPPQPSPYTPGLRELLHQAAKQLELDLAEGVYAAVTGPSYETLAEIRALRTWGADAVGMSTAREARAAAELGLDCAAVSLITNRAAGLGAGPIHHAEVLAAAAAAAGRLDRLIEAFLRRLKP